MNKDTLFGIQHTLCQQDVGTNIIRDNNRYKDGLDNIVRNG